MINLPCPVVPVQLVALRRFLALGAVALGFLLNPPSLAGQAPPAPAGAGGQGRLAGQVVDRATGKPLAAARITLVGRPGVFQTDLDGRWRTPPIDAGVYGVRAAFIGYGGVLRDSVQVIANQTIIVNFVLEAALVELQEITVTTQREDRAASEAGLLAMQQAAPTVMDGISAETISKSPDSDASDAIARVTGASVVGDKFVYVRGLGERYGNTLLNGVELPSPEPLKKVVPLDLFPASLLESIITTKAGRPDRPGDVTGGGVEIVTKEFPENPVFQASVSSEYNSQTSFETVALAPRHFSDLFGFDNGRREPDGLPGPELLPTAAGEQWAESIRDVWTPQSQAPLNFGAGLNLGGLLTSGEIPVGALLSLNYSNKVEHQPLREYRITRETQITDLPPVELRYAQTAAVVDWGGVLNFTVRAGGSSKLSWRNLYSRNTEETFLQFRGINRDQTQTSNSHVYQAQYIQRDLFQTQLAGDHLLPILRSRVAWKASYAVTHRDEPENRSLLYLVNPNGTEAAQSQQNNYFFFRFLNDRIYTAQFDWGIPLSLRGPGDTEFKVGALYRSKRRDFDAATYNFKVNSADPAILELAPEQLFSPENLGPPTIGYQRTNGESAAGTGALDPSYTVRDDVIAAYAMLDVAILPRLRLVGGLRIEDWDLELVNGSSGDSAGTIVRTNRDPLWSANFTLVLSDRMNLRLSAFRSIARPEARELSPGFYVPVAGECASYGNPLLLRTSVYNGDVRWEWFPNPGEIVSLTGFFKHFDRPIFEQVEFPNTTRCQIRPFNAESARNYGFEAEVRKSLGFLGAGLFPFTLGANFTYVDSESLDRVVVGAGIPVVERRREFTGQSPYLANLNLRYDHESLGLTGTVLLNYFSDRIYRYGETIAAVSGNSVTIITIPDVVEEGRTTLDAKLGKRFGALTMSFSGRNLLNQPVRFVQRLDGGDLVASFYRTGISFSIGMGYDF